MPLESEIQKWMVSLLDGTDARRRNLWSVLTFNNDTLGQALERGRLPKIFPNVSENPFIHRAAREAYRVLESFHEPIFRSADKNISEQVGERLRPDVVLQDSISGAFIIIEIKRSKATAREFGTELLAYSESLLEQYPGSQIFYVQVSTSWAALEKRAFMRLAKKHLSVLPLEFVEGNQGKEGWTLKVRSDLLPKSHVRPFPEEALQIHTKTFLIPKRQHREGLNVHRIQQLVSSVAREADKGGTTGFIIAWYEPDDLYARYDNEFRIFISMGVRDPQHSDLKSTIESDAYNIDFESIKDDEISFEVPYEPPFDDTPVRFLQDLEIIPGGRVYSAESDLPWNLFIERLSQNKKEILVFDSYGEIADHISRMRIYERTSFNGLIRDITLFPSWHPINWLVFLERYIFTPVQPSVDPAMLAYKIGLDLGKVFLFKEKKNLTPRNFAFALAQIRFIQTWFRYFESNPLRRNKSIFINTSGYALDFDYMQQLFNVALNQIASSGDRQKVCLLLGYHESNECNNQNYILNEWKRLQTMEVQMPKELEINIFNIKQRFNLQ